MPDTTINSAGKSLEVLLQAEKDFPGYSLDICSGYLSTDGVLLLKRMLKADPKVRAIMGLMEFQDRIHITAPSHTPNWSLLRVSSIRHSVVTPKKHRDLALLCGEWCNWTGAKTKAMGF